MDEEERGHAGGSEVVVQIQDALLPTGLPLSPGVELAARYLLADVDLGAGGDWFDAIALEDGRVVIVVGDVAGRGVEAAVVMGQLKVLFEESVREDGDLAAAFDVVERRARRVRAARATTMCVCILDPATGDLTYCTAGHPPLLVIGTDGRATYLPTSGAGPLGSGVGFPTREHRLGAGEVLLLYNNGLLHRPGRTVEASSLELFETVQEVVRYHGPAADDLGDPWDETLIELVCRHTSEQLAELTGYTDDICLLAARRVPPVPPLELVLPPLPDTVRTARADLTDWLSRLRVTALDELALQHAVGELVANAVEHAYADAGRHDQIRVTVRLLGDGMLEIEVADDGRWDDTNGLVTDRGRGLAIAYGFVDELSVEHDDRGTRARIRHRLTSPVSVLRSVGSTPNLPDLHAVEVDADHDRVHVSGDLDEDGAAKLEQVLARLSRGATREITVDLAGVRLFSSAAVRVLLDARDTGAIHLLARRGSAAQQVLDLVQLPYETDGAG